MAKTNRKRKTPDFRPSFGKAVKTWEYKRFIDTFSKIYPDVDLDAEAERLGIQKPAKGNVQLPKATAE